MQRKPTKNTRGPNAEEKRFAAYTKGSDCIACGAEGPSIVDHVAGATYKHNKVLIGHWFLIPLCVECDTIKTQGSGKALVKNINNQGGINALEHYPCISLCSLWDSHTANYSTIPPHDVIRAVMTCGK